MKTTCEDAPKEKSAILDATAVFKSEDRCAEDEAYRKKQCQRVNVDRKDDEIIGQKHVDLVVVFKVKEIDTEEKKKEHF